MASKIFIGLVLSVILYFLFGPGPYQAVPYLQLQKLRDYSHLIRDPKEAENIRVINHPNLEYPQDLFVEGKYIYTGGYKGKLYQLDPALEMFTVVVQSVGQIMRIVKQGDIFYFLDMERGICVYDTVKQELEVLVSSKDFVFLDSFDISKEGVIYFSDASSKYDIENYPYDIYEGRPYGRLLSYDLKSKKIETLVSGLYFANGVELSPDQSVVYVAESGRFRVKRHYLKGEKAGQTDILIDQLPGVPDNLRFNDKGQLWIAQPTLRDSIIDYMLKTTFIRNLLGKLPLNLIKKITSMGKYSGGIKVNQEGKVLEFIQVPTKDFSVITTVLEANNTLYLGTIHHTDLGIIPRTSN